MAKIWICGCGEHFPTYQEYNRHRRRFHPRASCFFIGDTEHSGAKPKALHVQLRLGDKGR